MASCTPKKYGCEFEKMKIQVFQTIFEKMEKIAFLALEIALNGLLYPEKVWLWVWKDENSSISDDFWKNQENAFLSMEIALDGLLYPEKV